MKTKQIKKGNNILFCNINNENKVLKPQDVVTTWNNSFKRSSC